jgi:uncharacterized protein YbcV (DUF1398 family)
MPRTVSDLLRLKEGYSIKPLNMNDEFYRSLILFSILSLISDKLALRKVDFNDIKGSVPPPNTLKTTMKQSLNDITTINETIQKISPKIIKSSLHINDSHFVKYGNEFILIQLLLSSFYKFLDLSCLTIESIDNRKKTLIGFNNYIEYDKEIIKNKIPINGNIYKKELLAKEYSSHQISKLGNYPDFIIVNEWENEQDIDKELYNIATDCDILNNNSADKQVLKLFGNQEYKLITCISTNYTILPEKRDKSKHNVIYFIDENFNINTYTNREYESEKKIPGFIFQGKTIENVKCDKIYQLKLDQKYKYKGYEYAFENDKCDVNLSDYKDKTLNFSLLKGNRTLIYYRKNNTEVQPAKIVSTVHQIVAPRPQLPVSPKTAPIKEQPVKKKTKSPDSLSSLSGVVSVDNDFKKYLKEINFKDYLNDFKTRIHNYYNKSSHNLANKIIDDNNDNIHKENNDILKDKLQEILKTKDDLRLKLSLNKISSGDKKYIRQQIDKDMKKQRKALEMKLHIFLTMSFQIMILKIKSKAEKELNKIYKSDYKKELRKIKKTHNNQPISGSSLSLKSAVSVKAASPKTTTAGVQLLTPPIVATNKPIIGQKTHNKKKKK